ncbi:HET-domain-containing protein [Aulographum hederae CBS 113979]|uniref:HET-domain-containing protein n=1 Tax=Aulographum hederae CBS 113979 TaxID=1176131 RepID=A0A6G1GIT7_9PEZI|nr:HET-domain-containing protein [Aulographum hederae CBS 113979]
MRLLNVQTKELETFYRGIPSYAILSHTWGDEEVTFEDLAKGTGEKRGGYSKMIGACSVAASQGFSYIWIDTCCIDKASSAELSEAINSMFQWYQDASVCFAYLEDIVGAPDKLWFGFRINESRWFTRGWTLQEVIAPEAITFVVKENFLADIISKCTGIDHDVLVQGSAALCRQSNAKKMSRAAHRQTTRSDDIAYCLLGLFDVHMPLLYGEGTTKAFMRLQEEITKSSTDISILAWTPLKTSNLEYRGPYAFRLWPILNYDVVNCCVNEPPGVHK